MAAERAKGVTVVVGVGEGLGAALARRFAAGYRVALVARSADVIEKVAGEIRAGGGVAVPIQSDATVEAQIVAAHERIRLYATGKDQIRFVTHHDVDDDDVTRLLDFLASA